MACTVWVLTEQFADSEPETSIYTSADEAWHDLAERARAGGLPPEDVDPDASDSALARRMLDLWSGSLSLHEEVVR